MIQPTFAEGVALFALFVVVYFLGYLRGRIAEGRADG